MWSGGFNLCTSSGHALYFYQVLWNYLEWFQSYRADTISSPKIRKGNNSAKNVGGVMFVYLCMSSGHALYLCHVSWNYLQGLQSYGMMNRWRTDKRTDGGMDTQNVRGYNIIPRHFLYTGGLFQYYMLDESICHLRGCQIYFVAFMLFLRKILLANTVDPDQMQHHVASDLVLHCLPMTLLRVSL